MSIKLFSPLFLVALACLTLLSNCQPTPPTFVVAYTGVDNLVHTLQSNNGTTWALPTAIPASANTEGVAVAHNGGRTLGWMVLWNSGGTLNYVTGLGGLPSPTATTGIRWSATVTQVPRTAQVTLTPALAFGNQKWAAAYQTAGPDSTLRFHPSMLDQTPANTTTLERNTSIKLDSSPALAFGAGRFVLAFVGPSTAPKPRHLDLVAITSTDGGITWSEPSTIFPFTQVGQGQTQTAISSSDVSLSFVNGTFYAVGKLTSRTPPDNSNAIGSRIAVFSSSDGITWTTIVGRNSGPSVDSFAGTPGAAFEQCRLILAFPILQGGNNVGIQTGEGLPPCPNPTSFDFSSPSPIGIAPTAALGKKMAMAFGRGGG